MSVLVDTNVLLRRAQPDHPSHAAAVESVARLLAAGEPVYFTPQNIAEFWNVATRPAANNGLGFSVAVTLSEDAKNITVTLPGPGRSLVGLFYDGEQRIEPLCFSDAISALAELDCRSIAYSHLTAASRGRPTLRRQQFFARPAAALTVLA
jgi:hypothetical protein